MEITFICANCSGKIVAGSDDLGQLVACPTCSAQLPAPRPFVGKGVKIANFLITGHLGKGGIGEVYRATQLSTERECALKVLRSEISGQKHAVERFMREAKLAAQLNHPNIVTVLDAGEDCGFHFIAMTLIDGDTLDKVIETSGPLHEKTALKYIYKIAQALDHAWTDHHMLHRDIKPANIIIDSKGTPLLLDLGVARHAFEDCALTINGMVVGTPHYMSPEQAHGDRKLDCRSDIYSLGITLYELIAGVVPFTGETAMNVMTKQVLDEPTHITNIATSVSGVCAGLIHTMLAKAPEDRPQDYSDLCRRLKGILRGMHTTPGMRIPKPQTNPAQTRPQSTVVAPVPHNNGRRLWIVAAAVGLVGAIGLLAAGIHYSGNESVATPVAAPSRPVKPEPPPELTKPSPPRVDSPKPTPKPASPKDPDPAHEITVFADPRDGLLADGGNGNGGPPDGDCDDADDLVNTNQKQYVVKVGCFEQGEGAEKKQYHGVYVIPFRLPEPEPGFLLAGAQLSCSTWVVIGVQVVADLYGLKRSASSPLALPADFYVGPSDLSKDVVFLANDLLNEKSSTCAFDGEALAEFIRKQYANGAAGQFIFLRLSPDSSTRQLAGKGVLKVVPGESKKSLAPKLTLRFRSERQANLPRSD